MKTSKPRRRTPPTAAHRGKRKPAAPAKERAKSQRHLGDDERIAVRRVQALQLRISGASYRAIGKVLKVDVSVAWSDVQVELAALRDEAKKLGEEVLELELRRLDACVEGLSKRIKKGEPAAVQASMRVAERRAKLLDLDAPDKKELTGAGGAPLYRDLTDEQLRKQILEELGTTGAPA